MHHHPTHPEISADEHDHANDSAHVGHDAETFRRLFWGNLLLVVPLVVSSGQVQAWFGYALPEIITQFVPPMLGIAVFLWGGRPFLVGGWHEATSRRPGMMLLITMAITVAFVASIATTIGLADLDFWWELGALIVVMLLGHWQEMRAIGDARHALSALAAMLPDTAELLGPERAVTTVPVGTLEKDDVVIVRPGGRVPADGTIVDGSASVDESMITGESRPIRRGVDDRVVAGTVATDGAITVRIDAVGEDTALAGIQRLVAEAQRTHSGAQALADRAAGLLFYLAVAAAIATLLIWMAIGSASDGVIRSVTVLVIACPHALGLAIPLVISNTTGVGARHGILIKDRLALERMRGVDVILFDKTGTLTRGDHHVAEVATHGPWTADDVLSRAAAVEAQSEHPVAHAIRTSAADLAIPRAHNVEFLPGIGVAGIVEDRRVSVGGPALLAGRQVGEALASVTQVWRDRGASVLYVVVDDVPIGAMALEDEVRPESAAAIRRLARLGVEVALITGDAQQVADAVAEQLGIDEVFAEVLPGEKDAKVAELQARGHSVAMVGDGVNDAPALARSDVGIAIGAGTDAAIESAGIVLASSDPRGVLGIIELSRAAYRKMLQNLAWATGYNVLAIPIAGGMLAFAGVSISPAVGALLMSASTIVVALNAQTLRRLDLGSRDEDQQAD